MVSVCFPIQDYMERATGVMIAGLKNEIVGIRSSVRSGMDDLDRVRIIERGARNSNHCRILECPEMEEHQRNTSSTNCLFACHGFYKNCGRLV
mmetsp:Transcript_1316/g.2764  ORF Transcript_1316/g.2764 Transcript_1316/m.2764 type:complete len:93 (-) Transcript_1316:507-785(-)